MFTHQASEIRVSQINSVVDGFWPLGHMPSPWPALQASCLPLWVPRDAFSYLTLEVNFLNLAHLSLNPPLYSKSHGLSLKAAHRLGGRYIDG